jgi:hypothetical protein
MLAGALYESSKNVETKTAKFSRPFSIFQEWQAYTDMQHANELQELNTAHHIGS